MNERLYKNPEAFIWQVSEFFIFMRNTAVSREGSCRIFYRNQKRGRNPDKKDRIRDERRLKACRTSGKRFGYHNPAERFYETAELASVFENERKRLEQICRINT